MAKDVLVGSTGFVGGNLMASHTFERACHSTNIEEAFGEPNDLVVYAGVPAAMFLANQDPAADLAVMEQARQNLRRLRPARPVLISSIAVYPDSRGRTEEDAPDPAGLAPYGANRLQLEKWVREDFPQALILRLPALYGRGLKKNFLYDLHTLTPALLRPEKYHQLAAQSEAVAKGYSDAGNGFYRQNGQVDAGQLRAFFEASDFNALAFTDSRSRYQFYDLGLLWGHIQAALAQGLTLLNLTTPPISAGDLYRRLTGRKWENQLAAPPYDYDLRSRYAGLLGGGDGYLCSLEEEVESVRKFMNNWR